MAIEIKELIVRVIVNNNTPKTSSERKPSINSIDRKEIIKECIEKVIEKLEIRSLR